MSEFTLRQLRTLAAVHRNGKIVSASKELGLTQPAVSLQIKEAENIAGTPLFDRTTTGMRPTAAGRAVIEAALAIEEKLRELKDEVRALSTGRKGQLRLGVVSTAKYFAPSIMAAFRREFVDVEMTLLVGNRSEIITSLRDHMVDVAMMGRPPREVTVRSVMFGPHPFVIIAPRDHRLAGLRGFPKEQLAQENFLVREPGSGTRMALDMFLSELPARLETPSFEMGSNETIKQAVMAGLGIALISAHTIALEVEQKRLAVLDVEGMPIWRQWFSVSRAERSLTPVMKAFEDFLLAHGADFLPKIQ